jgi:hypothetical protein
VTPEDVEALRRARRETPSWLTLVAAALKPLLPPEAIDARPLAQDSWEPFSLEDGRTTTSAGE